MFFKTPPKDFKFDLEIATCILENAGEILLLKRARDKIEAGQWGVPGGKIDKTEQTRQAIVREVLEETGIRLNDGLKLFSTVYVRYPDFDFVNYLFHDLLVERPEVNLKLDEHDSYLWLSPQKAMQLNLVTDQDSCFREYYREV